MDGGLDFDKTRGLFCKIAVLRGGMDGGWDFDKIQGFFFAKLPGLLSIWAVRSPDPTAENCGRRGSMRCESLVQEQPQPLDAIERAKPGCLVGPGGSDWRSRPRFSPTRVSPPHNPASSLLPPMGKSNKKAAAAAVAAAPAAVPKGKKRDAADEIEKAVSAKKQKAAPPPKVDAKKAKKQPPPKKAESSSSGSEEEESESEEEVKVQTKKALPAKTVKQESSDDGSSDETSESDEEPAKKPAAKPSATIAKNGSKKGKQESSSDESGSDDESSEDDEAPAKPKAPAVAAKKEDSSESESESDSEDEDKSKTAKVAQPAKRAASKMSDDSDSDDSDSDDSDEEPPQKKQKDAAPSAAAKATAAKKETSSDDESDDESDEDSEEDEEDEEPAKTPKKEAPALTSGKQSATKEPKTPMDTQSQATGSKTLFMANVPFRAELEDVKEFFEAAGEVVDVRFPVYEDGSRKGFCYVEFVSAEAAKKACEEMSGKEMQGRAVRLDFAQERNAYTPRSGNDTGSFQKPVRGASSSVFIRGFDKNLEEDKIRSSLEQHFGECGEITRVSIPTDYETGAVKGIAYLDFKDQDSMSKALELSGSDIGGYELFVDEAKPKGDGQRGGGRSGGRSGGRFGERSGGRRGGGGRFGDRSGGRDSGGRFGRGGGGRGGNRGGGRGFGNRPSFGAASAGKKTTFGDD
uniref:RRM domain-containing protein n=2 Tax=Setaria italica TaxID=4555 RepID=K3YGI6_SETIT